MKIYDALDSLDEARNGIEYLGTSIGCVVSEVDLDDKLANGFYVLMSMLAENIGTAQDEIRQALQEKG